MRSVLDFAPKYEGSTPPEIFLNGETLETWDAHSWQVVLPNTIALPASSRWRCAELSLQQGIPMAHVITLRITDSTHAAIRRAQGHQARVREGWRQDAVRGRLQAGPRQPDHPFTATGGFPGRSARLSSHKQQRLISLQTSSGAVDHTS